jgi:hypothetical protein
VSRPTIGRLMAAVAVIAVGLALGTRQSVAVANLGAAGTIALLMLWIVLSRPPGSRARRWAGSFLLAALAIYLPTVLGVWLVRECSHCVEAWLTLWPLAPGRLLLGIALAYLPFHLEAIRAEWPELMTSAIMTGLVLLAFTSLAVRGGRWRYASLAVAGSASLVSAWLISAMLRA